jgi:hypothetical protein
MKEVSPDSKARIEVLDNQFDFGVVEQGKAAVIEHEFSFKSVGEEPLELTEVHPSCGCTASIPSATVFAPGETGVLRTSFETKGKYGDQHIEVLVRTNDPTASEHTFLLTGLILAPWHVVPATVDFNDLGRGEKQTKTTQVNSQLLKGSAVHKVLSLSSNHQAITAELKEFQLPQAPAEGKSYLEVERPVEITVHAGEEMGEDSGKVFVHTADPQSPTVTIDVRWKVSGDLDVSAQRISSIRIRGRNAPRPVVIKSRTGTPFEITSIEIKDKDGKEGVLVLTPDEKNSPTLKSYQVTIKEDAPSTRQPYLGNIVFKVDHPELDEVVVPYTATVRD